MIKNWWWEPEITVTDVMLGEIHRTIKDFARYLSVPCKESYTDVIMKKEEKL